MRLVSSFCTKLKNYSNFPAEYIERSKQQIYFKTPKYRANYLPRTVERKKFRYTTNREWTGQFRQQNMPGTIRKKVFVEPIEEWGIFKGDRVELLCGKDKGKQGIVAQVFPQRNWVIVEGLNCHHRKVGGDDNYPGILIKSEAPLLVNSQIALVDPSDLQRTEFEWRYTEDGEKVRVSITSGRIIPVPGANDETIDYKTQSSYVEREKDTLANVVTEVTYEPKLCTFEMDIMESEKIVENAIPQKSYWY